MRTESELVIPEIREPVMDQASLLSFSQKREIDNFLHKVNQSGKVQIGVLILDSVFENPMEVVSIKVADKWQLGTEKKDNGVILLIALKERKARIEVGQGLEGNIPDIVAAKIIREALTPQFKRQNYSGGIMAAVQQIAHYSGIDSPDLPHASEQGETWRSPRSLVTNLLFLLIFMVIVFFGFLESLLNKISSPGLGRRYRSGRFGGWSSGGGGFYGGGGFGGGGGGGFSGGGATGDW